MEEWGSGAGFLIWYGLICNYVFLILGNHLGVCGSLLYIEYVVFFREFQFFHFLFWVRLVLSTILCLVDIVVD